MRRGLVAVTAIMGLALGLAPVALSLFSRADAAEKLSGAVRPSMTSKGLVGLQSDFDLAFAAGDQFIQKTIPAVAGALHESTAQFAGSVASDFPHVATGVTRWYAMSADARNDIQIIERNQDGFKAADSIPLSSVSLTTGVWGFVALGAALLLTAFGLARSKGPVPVYVAAVLGIAAIAIPLAISFPHKTTQTNNTFKAIRNVLSRQEVDTLKGNLGVVKQMVPELTGKLIPALEQKLHMTPDQFTAFVKQNFAAVATGLANFDPILQRMQARVDTMDAGVPLYARTRKIPFTALPWLFFVPGALTLVFAVATLVKP